MLSALYSPEVWVGVSASTHNLFSTKSSRKTQRKRALSQQQVAHPSAKAQGLPAPERYKGFKAYILHMHDSYEKSVKINIK
jgi:hypothetical protein